ncbi:MAG: protein kinase [Holophagales bacterium]|nr:protein kinase [Holophagales bacterium]MBK9967627.1 protein kinase [Holophagales bacterium]
MSADAGNAEGTSIGRYRIEGLVGSGGMGTVYRGVDPFLCRVVAVKVLAGSSEDENAQERFFREARAIARLEHPNIVRIYEADATQGTPYIAMEYLDGQDGREFVKSGPSLTRSLDVMVQVFEGLACAHGLGVVHRDVKPGNMILLAGDVVKLIDFGLARLADDQRDLTRGMVFGSAPYMAPEQITSPGQIDARTDIYSASVILFNLVTGSLPYRGATVAETLVQIVHAPTPDVGTLRPDCPPAVAALIRRCMSKDPADRPSSALEVAETLRKISHRISHPRIVVPPGGPPLTELDFPEPPTGSTTNATALESDALTEYDLTGLGGPASVPPPALPVRPTPSSFRPILLAVGVAGLLLSIAAGTILWLRRPAASLPGSGGPALPARGSAATDPATPGGPRLVVENPTTREHRLHAQSGEKLSFRVRVEEQGPRAGEPQWRLNDELTAVGPVWTYTAGRGPRVDSVSVSIPGVEVTARTFVHWYVNVE